ncbi:MAG: Long-chain-fatty-acid--CoA ligase FadD15 [Owenweeksia sp. TMED14]|nr:MAG: Long-chain-fatty-acid--CoA ligase FadD15 [Owenweeksia sp. TMED14]|tara:strand:- start:561 stop:2327 length:1767 start_codon:yes stop_codon:yes gene_type:complete
MATKEPTRLFDFAYYALNQHPRKDALNTKLDGVWQSLSTQEYIDRSEKLARGLIDLGVKPGDKIAIISTNNRMEWNICDQAILSIGAIDVPVYPSITSEDYNFIFNDAEVKYCFLSDEDLFHKVNSIKDQVPSLENIYSFTPIKNCDSWDVVFSKDDQKHQAELMSRMANVQPEELATLIYTSGTTGTPKGVMLSHNNITQNAIAAAQRLPVDPSAKSLSFLPLCHSYERVLVYVYMKSGVGTYYAESLETIGDNLREIHPEVFSAVPRLLEKVFDKIMDKGKNLTGIKRLLFFWAVGLAEQYEHDGKSALYRIQLKIARKIIFSKWVEALGGEVLAVASGAAALNPKLARIFAGAGVNIQEGYGLTETSPVLTVNLPTGKGHKLGTVGTPLMGVEIKLDTDGEILARGPNIMMGYYGRPDLTAEVMTDDGWFRTGDIGEILTGGYLRITDRKKEIFKTSGGKYITPQKMENVFKESPFIEQCLVAGENEKFPVLLVQPQFEFLISWCQRKGIDFNSNDDLVNNPAVISRIQKEVEEKNEQFAKWEKVKKVYISNDAWTIKSGHLTPTMKLRRKPILAMYAEGYKSLF